MAELRVVRDGSEVDRLGWWMAENERLTRSLLEVLPLAEAWFREKQREARGAKFGRPQWTDLEDMRTTLGRARKAVSGLR